MNLQPINPYHIIQELTKENRELREENEKLREELADDTVAESNNGQKAE